MNHESWSIEHYALCFIFMFRVVCQLPISLKNGSVRRATVFLKEAVLLPAGAYFKDEEERDVFA